MYDDIAGELYICCELYHHYIFTNYNANASALYIYPVDKDDGTQPEAKPAGSLDDVDWGLTKSAFGTKHKGTGAKEKLAEIMMYYHLGYVKGMNIDPMREAVWDMIVRLGQFQDLSTSTKACVDSPKVNSVFDRFHVEFGDLIEQIPRLIHLNAAVNQAAGVTTRSRRTKPEVIVKPSYLMQWAGKDYPINEWNDLVELWEKSYPPIDRNEREPDCDLKKYRVDCWNRLRPVWPVASWDRVVTRSQSNKHSIPEWFRAKYKLDIWGNVVTMDVRFSIIRLNLCHRTNLILFYGVGTRSRNLLLRCRPHIASGPRRRDSYRKPERLPARGQSRGERRISFAISLTR